MCERITTRVTQQSKGLLQVSPTLTASYDDNYDRGWSLKDLCTGSPTPFPVNDTAFGLAKEHLHLVFEFVHQSAHDYVFGNTRADRAAWLKPVNTDEIVRDVLNGALWLLQYGPILHTVKKQLRRTNGLGTMLRYALSADDISMANQKWFCHDIEKLVDSLQSWTSAVKDDNQLSQEMTRLQFSDSWPPDLRLPIVV